MKKLIVLLFSFLTFTVSAQIGNTYQVGGTGDSQGGDTLVYSYIQNRNDAGRAGQIINNQNDTLFIIAGDTLIIGGNRPFKIDADTAIVNNDLFSVTSEHATIGTSDFLMIAGDSGIFGPFQVPGIAFTVPTDTAGWGSGFYQGSNSLLNSYDNWLTFYLDSSGFYNAHSISKYENTLLMKNNFGANGSTAGLSVEYDPFAVGESDDLYKARLFVNQSPGVENGEFKINPKGGITSTATTDSITSNHILFRNHSKDTLMQLNNGGDLLLNGALTIADGTQSDGYVLTSDATGKSSWQTGNGLTGWAQYLDTFYTSSNKFAVAEFDTVTIPNLAQSVINSQLPTGVDSLYNRADTTIIGVNIGDQYSIRIDFKAEVDINNGYCDILLDIGGSQGIILSKVVTFPRGSNTPQSFSLTTDYYTLNTFVANGGKLRVYAAAGDLLMWDINYLISRSHKAK